MNLKCDLIYLLVSSLTLTPCLAILRSRMYIHTDVRTPCSLPITMSLAELPATQKNDMVVSLAALLLEDAGEPASCLMQE